MLCEFDVLKGKIITKIEKSDNEMIFHCDNGDKYLMYHQQDCCETVEIDDICGELEWLIDSPILLAEERCSNENSRQHSFGFDESFQWTFYEIATIKGSVTIRWYGTSNGYYSESVSLYKMDIEENMQRTEFEPKRESDKLPHDHNSRYAQEIAKKLQGFDNYLEAVDIIPISGNRLQMVLAAFRMQFLDYYKPDGDWESNSQ